MLEQREIKYILDMKKRKYTFDTSTAVEKKRRARDDEHTVKHIRIFVMRIIHNGKLMSSYIISLIDLIWYDKKKDVFFQLHYAAILFCVCVLVDDNDGQHFDYIKTQS